MPGFSCQLIANSQESLDDLVCVGRASQNHSAGCRTHVGPLFISNSSPLSYPRFPDVGYFRDPEVQSDLTNVLFIYSLQNPVLGYRQGMHELLALLYYACDFDSISEAQAPRLRNRELADLLSRAWVTADAYTLFLAVMRGVGRWYEWREPPVTLQKGSPSLGQGPVEIQPYVAPIVEACNRIQSTYLKSVDPDLWKHLQASGIEAQLYGM